MLDLDAEEMLVYQSDAFKQDAADRLLKLLMISRVNKFPLGIIDRLKWDLGLPQDYVKSIVPEFPDYFRVVGGNEPVLELVCWIEELGTSVMEKKAKTRGKESGVGNEFPMHYSAGFEVDKQFKKWLDEWQKLPLISPYQSAVHLPPKSDESDKWAVGILHELLHIFVTKKTERDNVLSIGQHLGIRSMFKRVLLHHPGIFYLSSMNGTYTVVLKEAFRRGVLIESNPLMSLRSKYIHLMHTVMEDNKQINLAAGTNQQQLQKMEISPDSDVDDESNDLGDDISDNEVDEDDEIKTRSRRPVPSHRGNKNKIGLNLKGPSKTYIREKSQSQRKDNHRFRRSTKITST